MEQANDQDVQGLEAMHVENGNKKIIIVLKMMHQSIPIVLRSETKLVRNWISFVANNQQCEM